jgi:hypothetical protein
MVVIETGGPDQLYGKARGIEDVTFSLAFPASTLAAVARAAIGAWYSSVADLAG